MASQFDSPHYAERLAQLARIILAPDRAFFWQAAVFSVAISVLTLAVPLSVQILIGTVANIALLRPIVVLAVVLFTLLAMYGCKCNRPVKPPSRWLHRKTALFCGSRPEAALPS